LRVPVSPSAQGPFVTLSLPGLRPAICRSPASSCACSVMRW